MAKFNVTIEKKNNVTCIKGITKHLINPFSFCMYYVDGLLIDTGPSCARKEIIGIIKQLKPEIIVLTHFHEDHSGNAAWLSKYFQIPVYMGERTAEILTNSLHIPLYRRLLWGKVQHLDKSAITNKVETSNYKFSLIPTPGHSHDHICILEEDQGWLFSGDLYLGKRLLYGINGESIPDMIASINRILKHEFDMVFCGHKGIVSKGKNALKEKLEFLYWLEEETNKLSNEGLDPIQISKRLLPPQKFLEIVSSGELSPVHLVTSLIKKNDQPTHI